MSIIPFDNEDRLRYGGLRVGDLITYHITEKPMFCIVLGYGSDDNSVLAEILPEGKKRHFHPDFCTILVKAERLREVLK